MQEPQQTLILLVSVSNIARAQSPNSLNGLPIHQVLKKMVNDLFA
jgi:hypothetical protein